MAEVLDRPRIILREEPTGELYVSEANLYAERVPNRPSIATVEDMSTLAVQSSMEAKTPEPTPAAVTRQTRASMTERFFSSRLADKVLTGRMGRLAVPATAVMLALPVAAGAKAEKAEASTPPATITSEKTTLKIQVGKSGMSTESFSRATVLGNHRTVSKAKMRRAERNGDCVTMDGSKTRIWTQGRHERGRPYGRDTRVSRFCRWNGQWYRKACGNLAKFRRPKQAVRGPVIWVNNFSKAKLTVKANSEATAQAGCNTGGAFAYAYGNGKGEASARIRIRNALKAKGRSLRKLITRQSLEASGEARSSASAQAYAECRDQETVTTVTPPPPPPPKPPEEQPKGSTGINVIGPKHLKPGGIFDACAYVDDPEGDANRHNVIFSEFGQGEFISNKYPGDESNEICITYRAGTEAEIAAIEAQITDARGNFARDREEFEVNTTEGEFDPQSRL